MKGTPNLKNLVTSVCLIITPLGYAHQVLPVNEPLCEVQTLYQMLQQAFQRRGPLLSSAGRLRRKRSSELRRARFFRHSTRFGLLQYPDLSTRPPGFALGARRGDVSPSHYQSHPKDRQRQKQYVIPSGRRQHSDVQLRIFCG